MTMGRQATLASAMTRARSRTREEFAAAGIAKGPVLAVEVRAESQLRAQAQGELRA